MLTVVAGKESLAEGASLFEAAESFREIRAIPQGFELGLGEGVIVTGVETAMGLGDAQIGEQKRYQCWMFSITVPARSAASGRCR